MPPPLNIAMLGCGFMGRAHSNAWRRVGNFFDVPREPVLQVACARRRAHLDGFARTWAYRHTETDWRRVLERDDVDAVDVCVPNHLHHEICLAAAAAGKMVLCEKPLAMHAAEAREMCEAVENAGVANLVWYNYRRIPAVSLARRLIGEGRLGRVFHYRAAFLQDWTIAPELPQGGEGLWRLDAASAGSGVTGDLLAHCIDTALWLNGPIVDVNAVTETFVRERVHTDTGAPAPVRIDDACAFLCHFANGALGNFESTRYARGHKAGYTLEVNGEHGSLAWDLEDLHRLAFFDHRDAGTVRGWRSIHVSDTGGEHPYMDRWWVPGLQIGYEHSFVHQAADFLAGLGTGEPARPTFRDALATQVVCDAVLASARRRQWVDID